MKTIMMLSSTMNIDDRTHIGSFKYPPTYLPIYLHIYSASVNTHACYMCSTLGAQIHGDPKARKASKASKASKA